MNRADRRRKAKQMNTPAKLEAFSSELERRLRREYNEELKKRYEKFIEDYTIVVAYILWYKEGYGMKRLPKVMNEMHRHFEMIEEGYVSIDEIRQMLKDEAHVELNFKEKKED